MNYEEFLDYIKIHIVDFFDEKEEKIDQNHGMNEEHYQVELHQVIKNNGILLDGITIRKKNETISPNIYLNHYFENYQMGKPLNSIMEEIYYQYKKAKDDSKFEIMNILDIDEIKDKIVIRLVNYEKNENLLKNCPFIPYLDLAITFRYIANKDDLGIATSLISYQEFNAWNMDIDELYKIAKDNTIREFPCKIDSLIHMISDSIMSGSDYMISDELRDELQNAEKFESSVEMYVLTNRSGINGATCILYDDILKAFAMTKEKNLYLLPSSLHEMMIVPENYNTEPEFLEQLVIEANQSAVGYIDLLSDHIYYYNRESDKITIYEKSKTEKVCYG